MKNSQRKIKNPRNALNLSRKSSARSAKRPDRADLLPRRVALECFSTSRQQFHSLSRPSAVGPAMPLPLRVCPRECIRQVLPICIPSFLDLREGISCFFAVSIPGFHETRNAIGVYLKNAFFFLIQIRMQKEESLNFQSLLFEIKEWLLQNLAVSIPACQELKNGF